MFGKNLVNAGFFESVKFTPRRGDIEVSLAN
jgi:hypothetical protein